MQIFLKLKSWQLFCLLVAAPVIGQFFVDPFSMAVDGVNISEIFLITGGISFIFMLILLTWYWSLGTQLNQFVSEELRPSSKLFKIGVVYPIGYVILFSLLFFAQFNYPALGWIPILICPFHFLATFFMIYIIYFISKNLVLAEKSTAVKFDDYIGPFFALSIYPIGIWFIQPRINALYQQNTT